MAPGRRSGSPNDETCTSRFHDLLGDRLQLVDLEDTAELRQQAMEQAEVAAGDADDGRDGLLICKILVGEHQVEFLPVMGENELHFILAQGTKGVRKADPRIELRIAGQALF